MSLDEQVDEGAPLGGAALAVGLGALVLALVQIPAAAAGVGWVPACLAWAIAPSAIGVGAMSLVIEDSPRGRRNARRGLALGVVSLVLQLGLAVALGSLAA